MLDVQAWIDDAKAADKRLRETWDAGSPADRKRTRSKGGECGRPVKLDRAEVRRLYAQGMGHREIAEQIGANQHTVKSFIAKYVGAD